jgi:hypothetical protein
MVNNSLNITKTDNHLFFQQYANFASLLRHQNIYQY